MNQTLIYKASKIQHSYGPQNAAALRGIDLEIYAGEFSLIIGPSGSGKSTLLNILGLIEPLQSGQLEFQGRHLGSLKEADKNKIRRYELGFIFQNFHLFDVLSAAENVAFFISRQGISGKEQKSRVQAALEAVDLWQLRHQRPQEMSGGQRQRVAIARALAKEPSVIIADEPTANLDQSTSRTILTLLKRLCADGRTLVMASHDPLAQSFATRILPICDGQIDPLGGPKHAH